MKGKALHKNRANGNDDDQHDQGDRISARPAAGPSTPAVMTIYVCHASSDMEVPSEEEVKPAAMGMPMALPSTQQPSTSAHGIHQL